MSDDFTIKIVDIDVPSRPIKWPMSIRMPNGEVVHGITGIKTVTEYLIKEMNMPIGMEEIENWFTYHTPTEVDQVAFVAIRNAAKELAKVIVNCTPPSADQTAAIRKVREAVMTANAAIACQGK